MERLDSVVSGTGGPVRAPQYPRWMASIREESGCCGTYLVAKLKLPADIEGRDFEDD